MTLSLHQLAERIGAKIVGNGSAHVARCASIEHAEADEVTFLANKKYLQFLETTKAAAVVIDAKMPCPDHVVRLVADDPYFAFRNAMVELHGFRRHPDPIAVAPKSAHRGCVHSSAKIGPDTVIHPCAVVEQGAVIGRNTVLYPGAYVGANAIVGDDCVLYPNVVIYDRCVLGNRVTLHGNTVIGQDGFGYATHKGAHHKIPQTGIVVIEDDVEMGASCAVERAAVGETRIGKGTKFADLISIGHGTTIGSHCLVVSLVGVSGSVDIGNYVVLGGQVGIVGHLRIGNRVQVAARSAVADDIPDGMKVGGKPAIDWEIAKRNLMVGTELYELYKRVRKLERELEHMRETQSK